MQYTENDVRLMLQGSERINRARREIEQFVAMVLAPIQETDLAGILTETGAAVHRFGKFKQLAEIPLNCSAHPEARISLETDKFNLEMVIRDRLASSVVGYEPEFVQRERLSLTACLVPSVREALPQVLEKLNTLFPEIVRRQMSIFL